jgi:hypothetical protein
MDNGLIFPYPCVRARDESILLTTQKVADPIPFEGKGQPPAAWDPDG